MTTGTAQDQDLEIRVHPRESAEKKLPFRRSARQIPHTLLSNMHLSWLCA
jgi:hypothetical protein